MGADEVPLTGGRVTAGVVRVGNTVRRPMRGDHGRQHALLRHLEAKGFDGAPRFLGIDEQGREVLSYLEGEVPADLGHFDDAQLAAAARLLRRFHDATADFAASAETICHNDFTPSNAVFRDGVPLGMIDFDTARPGLRLWDLGYSAFAWLDLGDDTYTGAEQIRRLTGFAEAYGLPACGAPEIAVHALARQTSLAASSRGKGATATAEWAAACADWTAAHVVEPLVSTGQFG
jgi:Ser/Thr protein kinase RdoA (MazF antagonist)